MFEEFLDRPTQSTESHLGARWLFLRGLGLIFFSAFYSLWFQIEGLIGPRGILPAQEFTAAAWNALGAKALWLVPSLFWLGASDRALLTIVALGMLASVALVLNLWPRVSIGVALVCFLSFVAAARDFAAYQSDGMLLEAAFLSLFFAPRGLRPGLGASHPPSWPSLWLLRYEWFRIYFESGVVKIASGEPQWRNLTAMDKYYENGPLPTWVGWYVQQWPHAFHATSAAYTLLVELLLVWIIFFGPRSRIVAFALTTPLQLTIIATANYAFLNYLVLLLGVLLLPDRGAAAASAAGTSISAGESARRSTVVAVVLSTHFITTTAMFLFPTFPTAQLLAPTRIVNSFGLFAVMTRNRYEIEFQATTDGRTWIAYPFRYKPQDPRKRPGIFAPYQPRFDWNLWFASLDVWENNEWVVVTEQRLLKRSPPVLALFAGDPLHGKPPLRVRTMLWQYWFTTAEERRRTGAWWRRELRGPYAPEVPE